MSKSRRRKKNKPRSANEHVATQERVEHQASVGFAGRGRVARRASLQSAVFALMVTLGFVGFAVFFTFFYSEDANHFLYGGVMGLTALGWLVIATRRWSSYRQRARA
jgi:hypothetical protein